MVLMKTKTLRMTMERLMDTINSMSILKFLLVRSGIAHGAAHHVVGYWSSPSLFLADIHTAKNVLCE